MSMETQNLQSTLLVGVDVGSTTTKIAVLERGELLFSDYRRHGAAQLRSVFQAVAALAEHFPGRVHHAAGHEPELCG